LTLNFDKISTDLSSVIFQFGRVGALFGVTKPTKATPRGDRTESQSFKLFFESSQSRVTRAVESHQVIVSLDRVNVGSYKFSHFPYGLFLV